MRTLNKNDLAAVQGGVLAAGARVATRYAAHLPTWRHGLPARPPVLGGPVHATSSQLTAATR